MTIKTALTLWSVMKNKTVVHSWKWYIFAYCLLQKNRFTFTNYSSSLCHTCNHQNNPSDTKSCHLSSPTEPTKLTPCALCNQILKTSDDGSPIKNKVWRLTQLLYIPHIFIIINHLFLGSWNLKRWYAKINHRHTSMIIYHLLEG